MLKKIAFSAFAILCLHAPLSAQNAQLTLSNKHASREAIALYKYIQDMYGKKILSGQMVSGWGFDELKYIQDSTGKLPAIRGMDFIDSTQNENQVRYAREWWQKGGIPTIMWHWGAPGIGQGYVNSKKEVDIDKCFQPGTIEYIAFWKELKEKAALLKELEKAHIPVLWRPFHELNGDWFWWGKKGPAQFKRLWTTMYDYFEKKEKLNNLIWVLCYSGKPDSAWYPGREYVDIAGADTYGPNSPHKEMYAAMASIVGDKMPIPFHECGIPPEPAQCMEEGARWSWFMEWHTSFLRKIDPAYLRHIYNDDLVITLDKVPNIMVVYGK